MFLTWSSLMLHRRKKVIQVRKKRERVSVLQLDLITVGMFKSV